MEDEAIPAEILGIKCTQGENRICELVRHLSTCNQLLWNAALQLREDIRGNLGDLSVGRVPGICRNFPVCNDCVHNETCARDLLQWLLLSHRCVVAVEAEYNVLNSRSMVETLVSAPRLRRLAVFGVERKDAEVPQEGAEDAGDGMYLPPEENAETAAALDIPVRLLEKDDAGLVSLDVTALEMNLQTADKLNDALRNNHTIEELAVGDNVLAAPSFRDISTPFVRYLEKSNPTLRTLVLKGSLVTFEPEALETLARAICRVSTLTDLTMDGDATRRKCALLLRELLESRYLLTLNFLLGVSPRFVHNLPPCEKLPVPSWVSALAKNEKLQKLELDVSWTFTTDCGKLLEVFPSKHSLRSLSLRGFRTDGDLAKACCIIKQRNLGCRISIHDYIVQPSDDLASFVYETVKSVDVRCADFWADPPSLRDIFSVMVSWLHVTSLRVHLRTFDEEVFLSLAAYIKAITSLKEIELRIAIYIPDDEENAADEGEDSPPLQSVSKLCDALSSNVGIAVVRLDTTIEIGDSGCRALADAATNRHVHELSVKGVKDTSIPVFLDRLLSRLGDGLNLLLLEIPVCVKPNDPMRDAQDMVRRNCGIVDRATRFVMKDRRPCCARAFEIVGEEPVLAYVARRRLNEDAMAEILEAQKFLRDLDVHTFMRLAGVVQERVVCHASEDSRRQLDRLHYDSWMCLRRLLRLGDVVLP